MTSKWTLRLIAQNPAFKNYPFPLNVREGIRKFLDQMLEYGILKECPEPSNFVSNLLITKKQ
jgi:hypothetical protein